MKIGVARNSNPERRTNIDNILLPIWLELLSWQTKKLPRNPAFFIGLTAAATNTNSQPG
jgi:hypothetical protein